MSSLSPGSVIDGSFELLRTIGEGGMGEVWLARDRALGRDVALKAMRPSDSASRSRRFEREARALAALDHPSILPVLHAGEDPATGLRYLVTPAVLLSPSEIARLCDVVLFCPYPHGFAPPGTGAGGASSPDEPPGGAGTGGASPPGEPPGGAGGAAPRPLPLAALLDGGKTLPEAAVLRIARDLAGALAAAHAVGILHRDVKPSNVLFDASGRALLADFGLAKFVTRHSSLVTPAAQPTDSISLDESGTRKFLGSPAYAAPETFREGAAPSPALDWYSFGAVLYEALTGDRPRSLRKPSSFDPGHISRRWDSFLAALLEPDPARRLSDSAVIARRLDALARAIAPATRRRRRVAVFALAVAAVLAVVTGVLRFRAEPGPAVETFAESAESAAPGPAAGWGSGEAEPPPVAVVFPAYPMPPRLDSIWQGEDRGPLQLLGTFRLSPIVRLEAEAFTGDGAEILRKLHEGDGAWSSWTRDRAALERAKNVWSEAVGIARKEAAYADAAPAARVRLALCLARLSWTHVANADHGAADEPYRAALAAVDPLVESDPARYGPLRSWLLSERAYMECMEGRFGEAAEDLKESGILWATYAPEDDPGCRAQLAVLAASLGGMAKAVGDPANAIKPTEGAIKELAGLVGDPPVPDGPASAALANLLVGCHYRLGDLDASIANRLEALRHYRLALDAWRSVRAATGASDPDADAQILGRIGGALAELERYAEAADAWAEMREALREPLASDPARYRPVVADILGNEARAFRLLGDEERARALEAEAAALAQP